MGIGTSYSRLGFSVRETVADDCRSLGEVLAPEDVREFYAAHGLEPITGLERCHALSENSRVMLTPEDEILCMWGAVPLEDIPAANVWMLCSPLVKQYPVAFSRMIRELLSELSTSYGCLIVYADARNIDHLRWLRHIGFRATEFIEEYGFLELPFFELSGVF